jgi:hypothetical protein
MTNAAAAVASLGSRCFPIWVASKEIRIDSGTKTIRMLLKLLVSTRSF